MRLSLILSGLVLFIVVFATSSFGKTSGYVEITKPFVSVYKYLDPKSEIIIQASKNDHFELIYEGISWYQIKVNDNVGWVEKSAGEIVTTAGATILSIPVGTFCFFLFLLIATITGTCLLIYRQKTAEL